MLGLDKQAVAETEDAKARLAPLPTMLILALALGLRLSVIFTVVAHYPAQWLFTRGMEMGLLAKSLLAGTGLSSPFGGSTGPTAIVAPVYPILIAMVFRVCGEYSLVSAIVILVAQTAVNLITIWLMMLVARWLFDHKAATVSGMVWACSLPLAWMPTILWETSLSCCFLAGIFALVLKYRAMPQMGPQQWLLAGGYCGLGALVNPALLPSLAGSILWLAYVKRKQQGWHPLLALLTFVLVFSPWPIRNARVFHAFVPLRTTVGFELWMGNRPGATGFLDESLFPMFNRAELADYVARGEVAYSAHKSEMAKRYIASYPDEFVKLTTRRIVRFWTGTGTRGGSKLFAVHAVITTMFGFAGIALLVRRGRGDVAALFVLPILLFPLPYVMTHAEFRYRLVIDPIMTMAAGFALVELARATAARRSAEASSVSVSLEPPLTVQKAAAWQ